MEFLGIGPLELAFIIVIALVVVGPRDIVKFARTAGRFINRVYRSEAWRTLTEASRTLQTLPNRLAREAELEELNSVKQTLDETRKSLSEPAKPPGDGFRAGSEAQASDGSAAEATTDTTPQPVASSESRPAEAPAPVESDLKPPSS